MLVNFLCIFIFNLNFYIQIKIKNKMYIKKLKETNNEISFFSYEKNFLKEEDYKKIIYLLNNTNDWKDGLSYNGSNIKRKQKWFHTHNNYFCKDWNKKYDRWKSHEYTKDYYYIQNKIQKYVNIFLENKDIKKPNINSILINYYENGDNQIGFHKDNKKSFGDNPTIIILSLGDKRTIRFERTIPDKISRDKENKHLNFNCELEDNSIFIMGGNSQKNWVHSIIKGEDKNKRFSLTFREHLL